MADARTQEFITSLQNLLGNQLTDPNPDRTNTDTAPFGWIYNTPINFDLPQYPRIHISRVSQTFDFFEIGRDNQGAINQQVNDRIQIAVLVGTGEGNHLDIDGDDELERPFDIQDKIATDIADLIKNNQDRWESIGDQSLNMVPVNGQPVQTSASDVEAFVLEAEIRNIRG